mmetsp:Transcript_98956/g.220943  ORF Transcript_98956/g.220943 Transcript_98956/m.220943 type:complete len:219 (+) Transcript_98956:47-703(+)
MTVSAHISPLNVAPVRLDSYAQTDPQFLWIRLGRTASSRVESLNSKIYSLSLPTPIELGELYQNPLLVHCHSDHHALLHMLLDIRFPNCGWIGQLAHKLVNNVAPLSDGELATCRRGLVELRAVQKFVQLREVNHPVVVRVEGRQNLCHLLFCVVPAHPQSEEALQFCFVEAHVAVLIRPYQANDRIERAVVSIRIVAGVRATHHKLPRVNDAVPIEI